MSGIERSVKRRRQVFGVVVLLLALVVLAVALWGHVRRLTYVAVALAVAGVWMVSRRGNDGE